MNATKKDLSINFATKSVANVSVISVSQEGLAINVFQDISTFLNVLLVIATGMQTHAMNLLEFVSIVVIIQSEIVVKCKCLQTVLKTLNNQNFVLIKILQKPITHNLFVDDLVVCS